MNTVLITGSSRGIGRETALVFAQNGWNVAIHGYRHPERLASLEQEIKRLGVQCLSFTGDICDSYFVEQMIAGTISCFGGLDCLVNNAGISRVGLFTDTSEKDWQEMFHTNVMPLFASCKSVLPHMIRRQSGTILNISSVWGGAGASCEVLYSAAKGAVNTFTKALAKEVAPSNISVNALAFGMIDTEMNSGFTEEEKDMIRQEIPADRIAGPREAAEMIYHTCTAPRYLTGEIITFSGGW